MLMRALALLVCWIGLSGPETAMAVPLNCATASVEGLEAQPNEKSDALARIRCAGVLRVGLRDGYAPFSRWAKGLPEGFEPDIAALLAQGLGVRLQPVLVTPANRMALLGEGRVDLIIATMGHTVQRDGQARFVRPHYYESRTVVVGERQGLLSSLEGVGGRTICVTIGNLTNAELAARGARLRLFDSATAMLDHIRLGGCPLAAQDDAFFELPLREQAIAQRMEIKFGFSHTPWGMAVRQEDGLALQAWLSERLMQLHARGEMLSLAATWGLASEFLLDEQRRWSLPPCRADGVVAPGPAAQSDQGIDASCLRPPRDSSLRPTGMAAAVTELEAWFEHMLSWRVDLPMLKTHVAWGLFLSGIGYSLALVLGAVAATVGLAAVFAAGLRSDRLALRWCARGIQAIMQSTPLVLLMLVGDMAITGLGSQSPLAALGVAIVVLGLFNGSNAGQAVAETGGGLSLGHAMVRARTQIMSFAVNATRGSPAAAVMGVPELLSALTDISSFVSERSTTYALLLVFYMSVVFAVTAIGNSAIRRMEPMR